MFRNSTKQSGLLKETVEHFGKIDFLICNAGIWEGGPVESISEELWDKTLDINLKGHVVGLSRCGSAHEEPASMVEL